MHQTKRKPDPAHRQSNWALGLELRQLRALVVLVDAGNLSAAARHLGVAQSTMSESLAALERAIGTRVVVRKRGDRAVSLTPAGEALLPHARTVLASLEDAHAAVAGVDRDIRSRVDVIANESVSTYLLPAALADARSEWPNVRFSVTPATCLSIIERIAEARYDVVLTLQDACQEPAAGTSQRIFLADIPLTFFAAPGHPLAAHSDATRVSREQLARFPVLICDPRGLFDLVRNFFDADGLPVRIQATGSTEGVKRSLMREVLSVGVLPGYALEEELRTQRFAPVRVQPNLPRLRLEAMSYRQGPRAHPAVDTLVEAVRRHLNARVRPARAKSQRSHPPQ